MKRIGFYWINQWNFFWVKRPTFTFMNINIAFSRYLKGFHLEITILGLGFMVWFIQKD